MRPSAAGTGRRDRASRLALAHERGWELVLGRIDSSNAGRDIRKAWQHALTLHRVTPERRGWDDWIAPSRVCETAGRLAPPSRRRGHSPDTTHAGVLARSQAQAIFESVASMNVYLHTFGCQMNFLESELLESLLARAGMRLVRDHRQADVAIVNGCVVREHAEARAIQKAESLRRGGVPRVGVIGCLARREGGVESADFLVSPEHYDRLAEIISGRTEAHVAVSRRIRPLPGKPELTGYEGPGLAGVLPRVPRGVGAWLAISRGCDNFCSYCVVPHARGKEVSRDADEVVREMESLAAAGTKEVTLIGQNVNSYRHGSVDFPSLLERVDRLSLFPRVRFLTSHPRDMLRRTLEIVAASNTICHHLHLPLQAGSDPVLKRMNRGYTVEEYRSLVRLARKLMPHVGLTTDIMVGFPGESESDFRRTLAVVRDVEYDAAFTFGYSRRGGTAAARMEGALPRDVVRDRLEILIDAVRECAARRLARRVGGAAEVLIEGGSPKSSAECIGRSREGNTVVLPRSGWERGDIVRVRLRELRAFTFFGTPVAGERVGRRCLPKCTTGSRRTEDAEDTIVTEPVVQAVDRCVCATHHGRAE
jgi:tRNA-2-methylthio-N6-dimethylallyladenosine synthase